MKGRMEAGIKTIVAAGKTLSNVINGGVTLVIPRRMYARPFHNEDELRAQKHADFQTNDAGKKTGHGRSVPVWPSKHLILLR